MKKVLFIAISLIFFTSCSEIKNETKELNVDNGHFDSINPIKEKKSEAYVYRPDYSNPILIEGSSFGDFFRALYRIGDYKKMIAFTSNETKEKFNNEELMSFYKDMDFGYKMTLHAESLNEDGTHTLFYEANVIATKTLIKVNVIVENDSTKVVLDRLDYKNPF